jgi:hypothetical protein
MAISKSTLIFQDIDASNLFPEKKWDFKLPGQSQKKAAPILSEKIVRHNLI